MTLFVQDTFTGSGKLSSHTGELGASWSNVPGGAWNSSGYGPSAINLTGAAAVVNPATNSANGYGSVYNGDAVASGTPPLADYFVEIDFTLPSYQPDGLAAIYAYVRGAAAYPGVAWVKCNFGASSGDQYLEVYDPTGNVYDSVLASTFGGFTGSHTLRAEVEGGAIRAYLDGALLSSSTTLLTAAGHVGLGIWGTSNTDPSITEFRAGTLGAPPAFWRDRVLTVEL